MQQLEQSGDLIIAHHAPSMLADRLCDAIVQQWANEFFDEPPPEVVIETCLRSSARHLSERFGMDEADACAVAKGFMDWLASTRTLREVAELVTHQGAKEVADGAYFCVHLDKGEYYGPDYLDWRKAQYDGRT
ncbi:hypothetical protein [Variovorax sp. OK605]|uniref:hypothetical protein n=1 Tax=Variovorax sp. OK605 TaxID=1855317 RepID=UPI000B8039A5|nr:hypothetical protein [Variovorax sp. OK605]